MMPATRPWQRPLLDRDRPQRSAGGFYRTAETDDRRSGGTPLTGTDAAVIAAVRLAYRVADQQVDRSIQLAKRLRDAGDAEVGPDSDRHALDATERLVTKAMMSGLEWWETSVAQGRCPVKRLAAAEYQMIGTILGLGATAKAPGGGSSDPPAAGSPDPATSRAARPVEPSGDRPQASPVPPVVVVHHGAAAMRRAVLVAAYQCTAGATFSAVLVFFNADRHDADGWPAELTIDVEGQARLAVKIASQPPGRWRAAICNGRSEQVGFIDIVL